MKHDKQPTKKTIGALLVRGSDYLKYDRSIVPSGFYGPIVDDAERGGCEIWKIFFVLK